uniref:DUF1639 domain-containing protein n=1 Tax=Leersia perrieri TaxID=77586 RepID=A0A0D9WJF3_9ORYZ
MDSSPAMTNSTAPAAMSETPVTTPVTAPATRSRDPGLFKSFDLPAGWGCRRPMAFCLDSSAAVAAPAAVAVEPKRSASRSPPKGDETELAPAAVEAPRKHWNLRDRKGGRWEGVDDAQNPWSMDGGVARGFSVELTRQEIEDDFFAITGRKAPRKPAKRPKSVQRQIDAICPGNSLWEVNRDRYKVNEAARDGGGGGGGAAGEDHFDGGIEELRVKLMGHLRDAADRLRVPHASPQLPPPPAPPPPPPPSTTTTTKPAATQPPETNSDPELRAPPPPPPLLPPPPPLADGNGAAARPWNLRQRTRRRPATSLSSWAAVPGSSSSSSRRRKRAPFSVTLSPEEIEEDIYALTGARPRRRPRKRPRASLFPGLWLTEVTADAYRVPDE